MLEHSLSPPPLHHSPATSEFPSRDTTPSVRTPVGSAAPTVKRPARDRDLPAWFRRPEKGQTTIGLCLDTDTYPLEPSFDDHPLFGGSPPERMATATTPISIRHSTSPRSPQSSTLTAALQRENSGERQTAPRIDLDGMNRTDLLRAPSGDTNVKAEDGAKPISMRGVYGKDRRESIAQSLGTGMSWGGVSVGSWIRDEYAKCPHSSQGQILTA